MSTELPQEIQVETGEPAKEGTQPDRSIRWWPSITIVMVLAAFLAYTQVSPAFEGQNRVLAIQIIPILGCLLLWVWLVFASRASMRLRVGVSLAAVAVLALLGAVFRWEGVDGELWFQFSPRWNARPLTTASEIIVSDQTEPVDLSETTPQDYPQFLGPNRLGFRDGAALDPDWDARPPQLLWRQRIGEGWSSYAVVGNFALTQEQRGEQELTVCYELLTGKERWAHAEDTRYVSPISGDGPRSTPTVVEGRVYTCGGDGILCCLDGATGDLLWRHDLLREYGTNNNEFGYSCSPLVYEGRVIVSTGGQTGPTLAAYDELDGTLIWQTPAQDQMGYASPSVFTLCGRPQLIILNHPGPTGYDPDNGEKLWEYPWPGNESKVSQILPWKDDQVFVSSGYGGGSGLLQLETSPSGNITVEELWHSNAMKTKFTTAIIVDGHAYGLDNGILSCIEVETGKKRWKRGRYGHGQVILINDLLLVTGEFGEVALVKAQPDSFLELTRFDALEGKTWNYPVLTGDLLLVRNDREAACFRLPLAEP